MYEAVIYWQDYFFGARLLKSWQTADAEIQPRRVASKIKEIYGKLPEQFTTDDLVALGYEKTSVFTILSRWSIAGYIEDTTPHKRPKIYKKKVPEMVM